MIQRTEQESEYGEHYQISLDELLIIYDTLVLGLELPATVNAAINRKIEQYYLVQEYGFRVEREKKESERKQIEANGIRDFQQTVTQGISDSYVRWRGIEATLQLAQSPNTKIVIIGSGKDGLPVILGNVDTPMQPNPARRRHAARRGDAPRQQRSGAATPGRRQPAAPGKDAGQQSAEPGRTAVADRGAARAGPANSARRRRRTAARRSARSAVGTAAGRSRARPGHGPRSRTSFRERSVRERRRPDASDRRQRQDSRPRGRARAGRTPSGPPPPQAEGPPPPQAEGPAPPRCRTAGSPRPPEQPR